ncbi:MULTISPECIES: metallophosphoesterase [Arenibacter]|uniref:metallophosphoesterase n=1 Tax=Arenibacter TaxID=178469 RepID=UPI001C06C4B6|nr:MULTISPECIES: metallophosphoesterase [Arenibacter]MBU2906314.1 metallophosphoesterase [Arenibacter algicola]MCK0136123.1 metallophosphoesterase [Arenibacter sp. S6351L]
MPYKNTSFNFKKSNFTHWIFMGAALLLFSCKDDQQPKSMDNDELTEESTAISFTAIGDVPYDEEQRDGLIDMISRHNAIDPSEFVIHVGDIKPGAVECNETVYQDVSDILKTFEAPTFIVLGDNEYNDCTDPQQGLEYWNQYFLHFNENWAFEPAVTYQPERTENFSWIENKVLFIGVNLVGSQVHDSLEWQTRLTQNGQWVKKLLEEHLNKVEAMVVFGHANIVEAGPDKFKPFTDLFRSAAQSFGKPVLMVQGDGHFWIKNKPWPEQNITRLQIDGRDTAVKITVDTTLDYPFTFDRQFLD